MIAESDDMRRNDGRRSSSGRPKQGILGFLLLQFVLFGFPYPAFFLQPVIANDLQKAVISMLSQMESSYSRVNDYVATFHKQERVDGKLLPEETILLKFQKPLKVYMKWIEEPLKGTEALYVEGNYDNKVIAHRGGVLSFVTLSLDPRSSLAMQGNRHPITEVGFGFIIEEIRRNIRAAIPHGDFEVVRMAEEPYRGRAATVVEARFKHREGRKYYTSRAVCHLDKELQLPIGTAFYDENDLLFEKYSYTDVKLNVGLTDKDFSRHNDAYRF